jgi:capsular polysaccharide biosynthesis protein
MFEHDSNTITITKVDNGYVVRVVVPRQQPSQAALIAEQFRAIVPVIREAQETDEVMAKIKAERGDYDPVIIESYSPVKTFVAQSWPAVLKILQDYQI